MGRFCEDSPWATAFLAMAESPAYQEYFELAHYFQHRGK